jgi:hypothetical protein
VSRAPDSPRLTAAIEVVGRSTILHTLCMAATRGRRVLAGVALAGVAGVGVLGVASVSPLGTAGAQDAPAGADQATSHERPGRGEVLGEVLDGLVADGTIDQGQADKISEAFTAKAQELREQFGKGGGGLHGHRGEGLGAAATALGMDAQELKDALKGGQTLAQVAESKGVDVQVVIDALVAEATARIDAALAAGRIDAARADELKSNLTDRITTRVNTPREERRGHHGGGD